MRSRKALRWLLLSPLIALVCVVLLVLVVAFLGISINAAPWRDSIAQAASKALGREVALEGPLKMTLSLRPRLTVGGVAIANPAGFSAPQFATLGQAQLRLQLLPFLRNEVRVIELSAEDVRVRLEETADGRANWRFTLPPKAATPERTPSARTVTLEEIDRISFRRIALEYVAGGRTRYFNLDELSGTAPRAAPMQFALRGSVEKSFPYTVNINAGPLADIYDAGKPWPFELSLSFAGTALQFAGTATDLMSDPQTDATFGLGTQDLSELQRLLQTQFPPVGATGLAGRVQWRGRELKVSGLRGVMGQTTLEGDMTFDRSGTKPRLTGSLRLPVLDLRPFLGSSDAAQPAAESSDKGGDKVADLRKSYSEIEQQSYSLKELGLMDVDLSLAVDRWLGVTGDVRDAKLQVTVQQSHLRAPVQATVADVQVAGQIDVDTAAQVPQFSLWVGTQKSQLGRLAEVFAGARGVQGELGRFKLSLKGQGDHLATIVRTLSIDLQLLQARLSYGNIEGGRPVEFRLDTLQVAIPAAAKLNGRVNGSLMGTPFQARFTGGDLPTLARETSWPLVFDATATGATLHVEGVLAAPQAQTGTDLQFRLGAQRAGDVARLLGLSPSSTAQVAIEGHARMESDEWRLSPFTLRLGKSSMRADIARVGIGGQPLVQVQLTMDNLDVPEIESMLPPPKPNAKSKSAIELPILPQGIDLFDSDIDVKVKQVRLRKSSVTDVSFNGRIREGRMWPSPFGAQVGGVRFAGATAVDLRTQVPEASVWVAAERVDVGKLLQELGAVQDLQATTELLRMEVVGRGSRLGEMLERSSLLAELEGVAVTVRDPNGKWNVPIKISKGLAQAAPAQPVTLDLDGAIEDTPIKIRIASGALPAFMQTTGRVPYSLQVDAAGMHLELKGTAALPIAQRDAELELTLAGARFDSMNKLARVDLPPWGPWELKGRFQASKAGYEVPDLRLKVGSSTLNGRGSLLTSGVRPRLDMELTAPQIQLNDFSFKGWSLLDKKETKKKDDKALSVEEMRAKAKETAGQGQKLLSPQVMRTLDASLRVEVAQVLSGADQLGSGSLNAQLNEGRFVLDPAEVNVAGGSLRLAFTFEPTDDEVRLSANIRADQFDYGVLARRLKPEANIQGKFSLSFEVAARAPTLDSVMQHADGRIDVAVWPQDLKAGIFDLWAVNLFVALLPAVDPGSQSKVNCAIARFDLRAGKLKHDRILLDTSRMRVAGLGQVDFDTEQLFFRMVPMPKKPQFLSLATPVQVTGTITDFKIGVSASAVLETTARLFTSIVVVPLQKLAGRGMPADGNDVCGNAMRVTLPGG